MSKIDHEARVLEWLKEADTAPESQEVEGLDWLFSCTYPDKPLIVARPTNKSFVLVQRVIEVSPGDIKNMAQSPQETRNKVDFNLKRNFLYKGVRYNLKYESPEENKIVRQVLIQDMIYFDCLDQHILMASLNRVHDASILTILTLANSDLL